MQNLFSISNISYEKKNKVTSKLYIKNLWKSSFNQNRNLQLIVQLRVDSIWKNIISQKVFMWIPKCVDA